MSKPGPRRGTLKRPGRSARRLLLGTAVSLLLAAIYAPAAAAGAKAVDARLDRALRDLVAIPGGPPGAIAIVQRGEEREVHRAGVPNLEFAGPIRPRQHMRLASVAKAFSGAVALQLVQRGRLRLDQSSRDVLPWLPAAWQAVTLRTLLQHTSGLPDFTQDPNFQAAVGSNPRRSFTHESLVLYVAGKPLEFPPGTAYHYSNTDNIVVALIAQAATGRSYEALLRRLVFRPLGMKRTSLPSGFTLPQPFVHGYVYDPGFPLEDVSEAVSASAPWASGGIVSTAFDLNTFIRAYAGKELLRKRVRGEQRKFFTGGGSEPPGPGANSAGMALFRYQTACGTVLGHTGNTPGFTQFAAATANGGRSATVSVNLQLTPDSGPPGLFEALRGAYELAACAALAGRSN